MPTVQLPDGTTALFPDSMAPADIQNAIQAHLGSQASPAGPPTTGATLSAAAPDSWLKQAENDFTQGGKRTAIGKILGVLQGRTNGYAGIDSGESKSAADFMGSPLLGLLHAGQSAQSIPEHPIKGPLGVIGGLLESATIPSAFMGGPAASKAINAIPSADHAAAVLNEITQAAHGVPVQMANTSPALSKFAYSVATGGDNSGVISKLAERVNPIHSFPEDINFPEARDFYTNVSRETAKPGFLRRALESPTQPAFRMNAGGVRAALGSDLTSAAETIGRGTDYTNAMNEYRQAAQIKSVLKKAGYVAAGEALRQSGILGKIAAGTMKVAQ